MNFYPFNIGDYAAATRHLSCDEDLMYRRMIDAYYTREAPLPVARKEVCRLVRAASAAHRAAVDTVLTEYFTEAVDGWRNHRCDEEIAKFLEGAVGREEKKKGEKERQSRHRERRKRLFDDLRVNGVVPAFDTPTEALQAMVTSRGGHAPVTRDTTQTQRLPNTNTNTNTNTKKESSAAILGTHAPVSLGGDAADEDWLTKIEAKLRAIPGIALHPIGVSPTVAPIPAMVREGLDLDLDVIPVIKAVLAKAKPGAVRTWSYFRDAILESKTSGDKTAAAVRAAVSADDETWSKRLDLARRDGEWDAGNWGPQPKEPSCRVPAHLLSADDGGWKIWKAAS